jgi:class 3 adenylate cyclase
MPHSQPWVEAMKKPSRAGGKPAKAQRRKALKLKGRNAPRAAPRRSSSRIGQIEVARLARELNEAQEQQAATADLLKVISQSAFNLQVVLDTLVQSAARLCEAEMASVVHPEGSVYRSSCHYGYSQNLIEFMETHPVHLGRGTVTGRTVLEGKPVQIPDVLADPEFTFTESVKIGGMRTMLGVPLLRDGVPMGVFVLSRRAVRPFSDKQIELVQNFSAQAVIAIENARLLTELRGSLQEQTATAEVLQVINSSSGDLEPVFAAMLEKAIRICDANFGNIYRWDGEVLHLLASHNTPPALAEARKHSPLRPYAETPVGRMVAHKAAFHSADMTAMPGYIDRSDPGAVAAVELGGVRTILAIPMLKENEMIGSFSVYRQEVRPFTNKQIALVTNFAAQAVIAIENARLLKELRERTAEVEKLNQHLEQRVADQVGEIERMGRLRRFLPPQVADLIVASGTEKQLESHRREITALFCDLRGFTGFSEASAPEDVMTLLRDYHAAIGEIIIKYSGTLERYAGDGVMVVFNDPVPVDNPALRAVQMALETRGAMGALTDKWRELGHDVGFGIGIAHGYATLGTIGFEGRFDYAAIGTVSNVASRLCDEAKPGQILISPRVFMAVKDAVTVEPVGEFTLKGIGRPLAAYNVLAAAPPNA